MSADEKSLVELVSALPPELQREVYDFAEYLYERRVKPKGAGKKLRQDWAGALKDVDESALDLEKRALDWRDDDLSG